MKIKHYAINWPITLKIPFTKQEKRFFRLLELNQDFEKQIINIRKKYNIPPEGFSYLKENEIGLGIPKYLDFNKWDQYLEDESAIGAQFGFAGTWGLSLTYFIKYNYMPKLAKDVVPRVAIFDGEFMFQSLQNDYPALRKRQVLISLRQKLSKEQLKTIIDLQWDRIEELTKTLPEWKPNKNLNIELYKEIALLKEKDKSWEEIISSLMEKYPFNKRVTDESYLRTLYSRYTKRLQKSSITSVSLSSSSK